MLEEITPICDTYEHIGFTAIICKVFILNDNDINVSDDLALDLCFQGGAMFSIL